MGRSVLDTIRCCMQRGQMEECVGVDVSDCGLVAAMGVVVWRNRVFGKGRKKVGTVVNAHWLSVSSTSSFPLPFPLPSSSSSSSATAKASLSNILLFLFFFFFFPQVQHHLQKCGDLLYFPSLLPPLRPLFPHRTCALEGRCWHARCCWHSWSHWLRPTNMTTW